jgi:hypothetical protein
MKPWFIHSQLGTLINNTNFLYKEIITYSAINFHIHLLTFKFYSNVIKSKFLLLCLMQIEMEIQRGMKGVTKCNQRDLNSHLIPAI